jgi:regulatory protein SWI6
MLIHCQVFNSFLKEAESQFSAEARIKQDNIDRTNTMIRELSTIQKTEQQRLDTLQQRIRTLNDRAQRISNLRRWIDTTKRIFATAEPSSLSNLRKSQIGDAEIDSGVPISSEFLGPDNLAVAQTMPSSTTADFTALMDQPASVDLTTLSEPQLAFLKSLPPTIILRARLEAYAKNNATLSSRIKQLKERDGDLEMQYRKVVALCTGVDESKIEVMLPSLMAAIESERADHDIARVRDFLRKVEGVDS